MRNMHHAALLDGMGPVSFVDVMTLCDELDEIVLPHLDERVQKRLIRLHRAMRWLGRMVREKSFTWDVLQLCEINHRITGQPPRLADGKACQSAMRFLGESQSSYEQALALFAFALKTPVFCESNLWTALLMANGVLMSHGHPAVSIPPHRHDAFDAALFQLREQNDATPLMQLVAQCHTPT